MGVGTIRRWYHAPWRGWCGLIGRLPERLFAPSPEPLPARPDGRDFPKKEDFERELAQFEQLVGTRKDWHDETSKTIRRVFYTLLGTCLFCVLTLVSSPDVNLITQTASVELPVLNYPIQFSAFLIVGPSVIVALLIYLHIFVAQGRRFELEVSTRQPILPNFDGVVARLTTIGVLYWLVPLTLAVFTWKAWPRPVGPGLGFFTVFVTSVLLILQLRRSAPVTRPWSLPLLITAALLFSGLSDQAWTNRYLDLASAKLDEADLRGMNLSRSNLVEAELNKALLEGARLVGANLVGAELREANLSGANLSGSDLTRTSLSRAILFGANLTSVNLDFADLTDANLGAVWLEDANLYMANLTNAGLNEAMLRRTFFAFANFSGASLYAADFADANLMNADLTGTNLHEANLLGACGNDGTVLPEGITLPNCD